MKRFEGQMCLSQTELLNQYGTNLNPFCQSQSQWFLHPLSNQAMHRVAQLVQTKILRI